MNFLTFLQAQAAPAAGQQGGSYTFLIMIVLIFVVMWFFMIRPQQKKQKAVQKAREALKIGDQVITSGGVYGKIKEIGDVFMMVEVANGINIKIDKTSIFASASDAKQN